MDSLEKQLISLVEKFLGTTGIMIGTPENIYFSHNHDVVFPSASIIKLPILWEFFRQVEAKKIDPNQQIQLHSKDRTLGSGVMAYFSESTALPLWDIATLMIIVSDNWATNLLIDLLGFENINQTCQKEGLKDTKLQRKMMDTTAPSEGRENFTSPKDTFSLLQKLIQPEASLSMNSRNQFIEILKAQQFNHKLSARWNDEVEFAHKTGELSLVDHDAGIIFNKTNQIIALCFTKDFLQLKDALALQNDVGEVIYKTFIK